MPDQPADTWDKWWESSAALQIPDDVLVRQFFFLKARGRGPVGRVLDLGCGDGINAAWLASQGAEVVATDFSSTCVQRAKERYGECPRLSFVQHDLCEGIPQDWGRFDLITDIRTLQHIPIQTVRTLVPSLRASLREGGSLLSILMSREMSAHPHFAANCEAPEEGSLLLSRQEGNGSGGIENAGYTHFYELSELQSLFSDFTETEFLRYGYDLPSYEAKRRLPGFQGTYSRQYWVVIAGGE